jgi:hypothetical protein
MKLQHQSQLRARKRSLANFDFLWSSPRVLDPPHPERMGPYARLYDWLRQRTTNRHLGVVLYGQALTDDQIGSEMGLSKRWVWRARRRLSRHGYISTRIARNGIIVLGNTYRITWPRKQMRLFGVGNRVEGNQAYVERDQEKVCKSQPTELPLPVGMTYQNRWGNSYKRKETPKLKDIPPRQPRGGDDPHLERWEQKIARLDREIHQIHEAHAGHDVPEDAWQRILVLTAELYEARTHLEEYEIYRRQEQEEQRRAAAPPTAKEEGATNAE